MSYDVVLRNTFYLRDLIESISLEDSLDEISYRATIRLVMTDDLPDIEPGQEIRISGIPYDGTSMAPLLNPGVVWDCEAADRGRQHLNITVYDRTIYLAKSEDERLMAAGQTAGQRLKMYAKDWDIRLGSVPDTGIALSRDVKRTQSIFSMIKADLKETVDKGGNMYRPRMTTSGLSLIQVGSNKTIWDLESIEELTRRRTLEGTVTQVKVLGTEKKASKASQQVDTSGMTLQEIARKYAGTVDGSGKLKSPELPSPILAVEKGETLKYGTLQKVIQDSKIKNADQARKAARKELSGIQETYSVAGPDINTIRAGDAVRLNGVKLIVTRVRHDLGYPGRMDLDLAREDKVRRDFY
ncbi:XkdQ/YqbQ family protein [Cohnella silvisoli]|uniref:Phage portal protein n=1 Tax=Cohnella silvisoli TaxID=2873699 RepID=A0ABV1L258_9BACL|nr:phage portal protein [Cohnella silvisoli]MCD9025744.1 phage portal protein [Cohnella silvisoli]